MNGREQIKAALSFRPTGLVPIDLGGTPATGIAVSSYGSLKRALGIETPTTIEVGPQMAFMEDEVAQRLDLATRILGPIPPETKHWIFPGGVEGEIDASVDLIEREDGTQSFDTCEGFRFEMLPGQWNFHATSRPLEHAETTRDIEHYFEKLPPEPSEKHKIALRDRARNLAGQPAAIIGCFPLATFEAWRFRGLEIFLTDFLAQPEMAEALMACCADYFLEYWRPVLRELGPQLDVVFLADDLATQQGLLISRDEYRTRVKPLQRRLWEELRRLAPEAKLLYHSCGAVEPLIADFIDLGVDALNPLQWGAAGMDPVELKRKYGRKIAFWGGGIDPAGALQHGSPAQVREEVKERLQVLAQDGGHVFAPIHEIQPQTPADNILAMIEAVQDWQ